MSQKIENQLNLALDATEAERQRSRSLNVGYDEEENEWELILKYSGSLEPVRELAVYVTELTGGYLIFVLNNYICFLFFTAHYASSSNDVFPRKRL